MVVTADRDLVIFEDMAGMFFRSPFFSRHVSVPHITSETGADEEAMRAAKGGNLGQIAGDTVAIGALRGPAQQSLGQPRRVFFVHSKRYTVMIAGRFRKECRPPLMWAFGLGVLATAL